MHEDWVNKAFLYELLERAFAFTARDTVDALADGAYAGALLDAVGSNGLDGALAEEVRADLAGYAGRDPEELWHELRTEYTRLFVGAPEPLVSPYAGIWYAHEVGVDPVLFVNKESMAVERTMQACGVRRPQGTNEPLDHIATECEFLNCLCLVRAGAVELHGAPEDAYETFYSERFAWWKDRFAQAVLAGAHEGLMCAAARVLVAMPDEPL